MDKSGRKALAANLAAITEAAGSRLSWTTARGIDTKTVERAEKNEGEKGVSLQAVDDIAKSLNLWAWQLLVPDLDLRRPPRIAMDSPPEPTIEQALGIIRARLVHAHGNESTMLGDALKLLAMTPDSERAFQNVITALNPTGREDSPPDSGGDASPGSRHEPGQAHTSPADPQKLGGSNQPEGGDEWMHRGRRIGPNIKPISRTTGKGQTAGKEKSK